jgi:hypothetical protein
VTVPEVVKADRRQLMVAHELLEKTCQEGWMAGLAVELGIHMVIVSERNAEPQ